MIIYEICPGTQKQPRYYLRWKNIFIEGKEIKGELRCDSFMYMNSVIKSVLKKQITVCVESFAKERKHAFSAWKPTTEQEVNRKKIYEDIINEFLYFAKIIEEKPLETILPELKQVVENEMIKFLPASNSTKYKSIADKIEMLRFVSCQGLDKIKAISQDYTQIQVINLAD
jgi:hypothetical protein